MRHLLFSFSLFFFFLFSLTHFFRGDRVYPPPPCRGTIGVGQARKKEYTDGA